ncbi:RNA-directed RNA polymerase 2 [Lentinula raphanica]|nr:RNA-directed RNA polymerase 2 [Lentinula raphanica]
MHRPIFSPDDPLNFQVRLFQPGRRGTWKRNNGSGLLTLPSEEVGESFLQMYGGDVPQISVMLRTKQVKFRKSTRPQVSGATIYKICHSPYIDPNQAVHASAKAATYHSVQWRQTSTIKTSRLQFGWECRDQIFSIEWDYHCRPHAALTFDINKSQIDICVRSYHVFIQYSQISSITLSSYDAIKPATVFFSLYTPPSFQEEVDPDTYFMGDYVPNLCLPALPLLDSNGDPHENVAPYTSLSLCLIFASEDGPSDFQHQAAINGLLNVPIEDFEYRTFHRCLFSKYNLESFNNWLPELSFDIACQLDSLLHGHCADPVELLCLLPMVRYLEKKAHTKGEWRQSFISSVFLDFGQKALDLYWDPIQNSKTLMECFQQCICTYDHILSPLYQHHMDDSLFHCLHVEIMPSAISIAGPMVERSNRVVRSFEHPHRQYFIRVSFLDDKRMPIHYDREVNGREYLMQRIFPFMSAGYKRNPYDYRPKKTLIIGGRPFYFLGYSQSSLKDHAVWFMTPFKEKGETVNFTTIIKSLGSFSGLSFDKQLMHCPARYAARISQAFTATNPIMTEVEEVKQLADIEVVDPSGNKWNFTDGVGTMSPEFAKKIYAEMNPRKKNLSDYPRAIQIRYLGAKGILSIDYRLKGLTIGLRPSMIKFIGAPSKKLEIAQVFDKPTQFYLNRPLIILLEGLGVPYETFKYYQDLAITEAHQAMQSFQTASHFFLINGLGSSFRLPDIMKDCAQFGIDDFSKQVLNLGVQHVLRDVKYRARIPVPGAYNLVGIADIFQELGPNEISVCIKEKNSNEQRFLSGPCLISRSPAIHPGDIQLVTAIQPRQGSVFLHEPMMNTIVFSTKGDRPIESALGGGDLDGDEYDLISLEDLPKFNLLPSQIQKPSLYKPSARVQLSRPCSLLDIAEFVIQFILSNAISQVALTWRVLADSSPEGILDRRCLQLADLHSQAVDYPKTGRPVNFGSIPRKTMYNNRLPDWYAPESMVVIDDTKYYHSQRALGKLFRAIDLSDLSDFKDGQYSHPEIPTLKEDMSVEELIAQMSSISIPSDSLYASIHRRVKPLIDSAMKHAGQSNIVQAQKMFVQYCTDLQRICSAHNIGHSKSNLLSEEEALVGTIRYSAGISTSIRNEHIRKLREETNVLVEGIYNTLSGKFGPSEYLTRAVCSLNLATMYVQQEDPVYGAHSFWWIAYGATREAIKEFRAARKAIA